MSYFAHVFIDCEGQFAALSNNPLFHEHYLKNHYYNADIHLAKNNSLGKSVLWDSILCAGDSEKMNKEAEEFGIRHTFTIIDKNKNGQHYYHFSTHLTDSSINYFYLQNVDLLHLFILDFNEKINRSNYLSQAYQVKFSIESSNSSFIMNSQERNKRRALFLHALKKEKNAIKSPLSVRELEVLSWLHYGKTLEQIALILGVKEITIKQYIATIKEKTQCYTQFQLGEYFSQLSLSSLD